MQDKDWLPETSKWEASLGSCFTNWAQLGCAAAFFAFVLLMTMLMQLTSTSSFTQLQLYMYMQHIFNSMASDNKESDQSSMCK